jgi:UDP-GlcNAc:undecaprenyl-phosphate GlcNAc-1-phosphate transferase
LKRKPIPYYGGLILFVVFFVCAFFFLELDKHLVGLLTAAALIVGVSFLDDRFNLNPLLRLGVQFLAAFTVVLSGIGMTSITNPFGGIIPLDTYQIPFEIGGVIYHFTVLADVFTILWIVAMINTVNWLDGLPGLVSGISFIGSLLIFMLGIRPNFHYIDQADVAILAIVMAGMTLAFWFFDFWPPKMLMGDTGAMFLGFLLAILSIFAGGKIATAFLIMGFPLLDFVWVIARRILQGKSPFKGDLYHFHHRLLRAGLTERQVVVTIYLISALFGGIALFLDSKEKLVAIGVMVVLMGGLGVWAVRKEGGRSL